MSYYPPVNHSRVAMYLQLTKKLTLPEKPLRRYPGILIGRLGVNQIFVEKGIGSEVIDFFKG